MSNSFYHTRYCLTKAQEEIIKPLLPAPKSTGRPSLNPLIVFNAILWMLSSGAAWRDLPTQATGIAFTTNSENGALTAFSRTS